MSNRSLRCRSKRRGFTLIDVAVGAAILTIVMSISVSLFTTATKSADNTHCHDNMEIIANLENEYKVSNSSHSYTATLSNLGTLTPTVPVCPDGGTYTVTVSTGTQTAQNGQTVPTGKIIISCSNPAHGKYAPEIDTP